MDTPTQRIDLGFVNAYLVRAGEGYILIDTGTGQQWKQLEAELLKSGCLPSRLKLVVITHGDADHTGNCARLQRQYAARIAMHRGDMEVVRSGVPLKHKARSVLARLALALLQGAGGSFDTFQPDVLLEEGQSLQEYGLAARVLHTPGHTPGSIAILAEDGRLFPGDTLANRSRPGRAPFFQDWQELNRSVARLQTLNATTVFPGHGKPFPHAGLLAIR